MRTLRSIGLLFILSLQISYTQPEIAERFLYRAQPYEGGMLPYRLFIPEVYDPTRAYPLVLTLHGRGQLGTDNRVQLESRMATVWADPVNQAKYPCFVVSPQAPPNDITWLRAWSDLQTTLIAIIDSLARVYSIDTNRLYLIGGSLGGRGTWQMITLCPGLFAAAVPMSGRSDPAWVASFAATPVWTFHGALDANVLPAFSRQMMAAMEEQGRRVVYTHCDGPICTGLPDTMITMYVESHADLFYSEIADGLHNEEFFSQWADYKYLLPWVFDKYRLTPGAIAFSEPAAYSRFSGTTTLRWTGGTPTDSVELWFSPDAGRTWRLLEHSIPNSGTYSWSTDGIQDCALGLLHIFLKNPAGHIYGRAESPFFAVDNAGNSPPSVALLRDPRITLHEPWIQDTAGVRFRAADPEGDPVHIAVLYSVDYGKTYEKLDSFLMPSDSLLSTRQIEIGSLANSDSALLRIGASDGSGSNFETSLPFVKQTQRLSGPPATQVGGASGRVNVHVVDSSRTTGNRYRVLFTESAETKWYDVTNTTTGIGLISHAAPPFDGVTEGPLFDGVRLVVKDFDPPEVDVAGCRWEVGSSPYRFVPWFGGPALVAKDLDPPEMDVAHPHRKVGSSPYRASISAPAISMGGSLTIHDVPYPADYRITISSTVVDTSSSAVFHLDRIPMKFTVRNITANRKAEVAYVDRDRSGDLSHLDEIYILEPDSTGNPMLAWGLRMWTLNPGFDPAPLPGDIYLFRTLKPIRSGDTFEFLGVVSSVAEQTVPSFYRLEQNYPNPFNPVTTILYALPHRFHVTLTVFNVLGQRIAELVKGEIDAGYHTVQFDGTGLASGVYFYRMVAGDFVQTRKLLLMK